MAADGTMRAKLVPLRMRKKEEKVTIDMGCPGCRERRMDRLVWDADGEQVTCQTCKQVYVPAVAPPAELLAAAAAILAARDCNMVTALEWRRLRRAVKAAKQGKVKP